MPTQISEVVQHLRRATLRHDEAGLTDGQLLGRFIEQRDEAAVAALVRRHGPMVWGVCRRILRTHHDAEDAFQATFLVLIRKARSVRNREIVGNWLYGVAHQTALRARATAAKQFARERQVVDMPEPAVKESELSCELQAVLDQELSRLPEKYRVGIVLCDLEGKTRKVVARQLGLPEGTLAGRLNRGRAMLAKRLARHGLAVSGGTLAAVLSQQAASACLPTSVVTSTIKAVALVAAGQAAAGMISAKAIALTEGVLKAMLMSKLKAVIAIVLVLGLIVTGATVLSCRTATAQTDKPPIAEERVDSIEGTWEIVSAVYDGTPRPGMEKRKWTITKTHIEYNDVTKDAYVIDSKASPNQIDSTQVRPGNERADGGKSLGIYEIKGDTLKMCVGYSGMRPRAFEGIAGRNLFTLKRVKAPEKHEPEKEALTAWGKEVGGLQAGLGFLPGEKRAYNPGETVKLVVRVRNVGKEAVRFQYFNEWFYEDPPAVVGGDGKPFPFKGVGFSGERQQVDVNLAPGKEVELSKLNVEIRSASEKGKDRPWTLYETGKFQIQYEKLGGNIGTGEIKFDPVLRKLATGKLELEVKEPEKMPPEKEAFTAWGKEVGRLQAGLGFRPGEKRAYSPGETVKLVVRVRNVGKEAVKFKYVRQFFIENPPAVTDGDGKPVPLPHTRVFGFHALVEVNLAPGKEIELYELKLEPRSATQSVNNWEWTLFGTGKFSVQYEQLVETANDKILGKLATGKLELEIKTETKEKGFTAWGKEFGGLQAGLGFRPYEKRAYSHGEMVKLVVRVRNVGKEEVKFSYLHPFFENQLAVTDGEGKPVPQQTVNDEIGERTPGELTLAPGKEIDLHQLRRELRPASESGNKRFESLHGTGKVNLQYERVLGMPSMGVPGWKLDSILGKLATGQLELEIVSDPPPAATGVK